jgi:tetratricopeptide (TPR) repeat protein
MMRGGDSLAKANRHSRLSQSLDEQGFPEAVGSTMLNRKQRRAQAKAAQAIRPLPDEQAFVDAFNEALQAYNAGQLDTAAAGFRRALALNPDHALTCNNLGGVLNAQGKYEEAVDLYRRSIASDPAFPMPYNNMGVSLRNLRRYDEAVASLMESIKIKRHNPEAFNNLALTLVDLGRFSEAVIGYDRALALKPDYPEAISNYGAVLREMGKPEEAVGYFQRALAMNPNISMAQKNLGLTLLQLGEFAEGWRGYEARWAADRLAPRSYPRPLWQGEPVQGKTLLLYAEQGLGDAIQFARFVPVLARQGAQVILEVHPQLVALMRTLPGVAAVTALFQPQPDFHQFHALMSVPGIMGVTPQTIPSEVPYLSADPARAAMWKERLGSHGFKVGIVWQGNVESPSLARRSATLACYEPLARVEGVRLISLQKGAQDGSVDPVVARLGVETLGPDFDAGPDAFLDTAAVMQHLDLVVTIDTSVAHLAGAMGRPTLIALKRVSDWRWRIDGADSPWYPTARLYRQREAGAWEEVFSRIADDLRAHLAGRAA